jgi:hypothetical protein
VTREVGAAGGRLRFVLPGTWANVPLDDAETTTRFVKQLVRRQVGRADRLARARREATTELTRNASDARALGAHTYLMALELLPGVPFPAALLVFDEQWPAAARTALEADDVVAALRAAYPAGEVAPQRHGPVARVAEMTRAATESGEELVTMRLEYHVPYPDRSRLLMARVNVPNIPSAEPFATLFDEIVDSVTFVDEPGVEGAEGDEGRTTAGAPVLGTGSVR